MDKFGMLYFILILSLLIVALMLLRLRLRATISSERRLLFVGLGRSGPEFDFTSKTGQIRLFGLNIKTISLIEEEGRKKKPKKKREKKPKERKAGRKRSPGDFLKVMPSVASAAWNYFVSLLKSIIVEQLEGEIEAGFDSPDTTGTAFGYYQAALGAAPAVVGRINYIPRWDGAMFDGSMKVSLAIPVYRIVFTTLVFVYKLPLRDLIKLAIGKKKGDQDVQ